MIMSRRLSAGGKERDGEKRNKEIYSLIPTTVYSIGFRLHFILRCPCYTVIIHLSTE